MIVTSRRSAPDLSPPVASAEVPPGRRNLRKRRAWTPNSDDHLIYRWVRFEGMKQSWVAYQLNISQATVSRVVQRYERWKAHADPRDDGGLDSAERARAQRWLTYERNEIVIASALRLAGEMEGFTELQDSVSKYPQSHPSQETEVRRQTRLIDRHGMVSRFLRIVHRVNMDQQKFVEQEPLPKPEPLSEEQIAREAAEAAADREEKRQNLAASEAYNNECRRKEVEVNGDAEALRQFDEEVAAATARTAAEHEAQRAAEEATQWAEEEEAEEEEVEEATPRLAVVGSAESADRLTERLGTERWEEEKVDSACRAEPDAASDVHLPIEVPPGRRDLPGFMQEVHKLHTPSGKKTAASDDAAARCDETGPPDVFCEPGCIEPVAVDQAGTSTRPTGRRHRPRDGAPVRGGPLECTRP